MIDEQVMYFFKKLRPTGHMMAKAYRRYDRETVDSLIAMGVINAVQRLDPSKSEHPECYITWWIKKMINEELRDKHEQTTSEICIPPEHRQHAEEIFSGHERNTPIRLSKTESRNLMHLLNIMGFNGYIPSRPVMLLDGPKKELRLKVTVFRYRQDDLQLFSEDEDQQIPDEPEEFVMPTSDEVSDLVAVLFFTLDEIEQRVVGSLSGIMAYRKVTRNELARKLGKDKKTIKSIYERALRKMQNALASRAIEYSILQ